MRALLRISLVLVCVGVLGSIAEARPRRARTATVVDVVTAAHPLVPLTADEHRAAYEIARAHFAASSALPDDGLLFPYLALREPSKASVLAWRGGAFAREATLHVLHAASNRTWVATIDLRTSTVSGLMLLPAGTQPAVTAEEYVIADALVREYQPWQEAMRARGVDPDDVYIDVWAPGDQALPPTVLSSLPHGSDTRLLRALAFLRGASVDDYDGSEPQNPYVRPIEGVVVSIDMNRGVVAHMTNTVIRPVSSETGNASTRRTGLQPMRIVQPNGSGFEIEGQRVTWQNWQFYAILHPREGLVLYDVRYRDGDRLRRVAYRLSLSEIYVPYGLADENWSWRTAFDVGEYNLGTFAQTLETNRDVPEHAHFFDAVFGSDLGPTEDNPTGTYDYSRTIGMYERDNGILWTRTDPSNAERETRGRRDLVVTWNTWIGNYIYGFDWIFGQDGSIEVKVLLTGTTLNRGTDGHEGDAAMAPLVGMDENGTHVAAPNHQHFFSFRMDLDIDGVENIAAETDIVGLDVPGFSNAFGPVETVLTSETARDAEPRVSRHWEVASATSENRVHGHPAYAIETRDVTWPLSGEFYEPLERAAFASHAFWVTRYRDGELYAAGDFPNQGKTSAGLPAFITPAEPLLTQTGTDLVVWPTIGMTHVPRPEDFPVMPVESISLRLVPHGFFDRNPALDAQELPTTGRRIRTVRNGAR
jgi:primary-amine oxidase